MKLQTKITSLKMEGNKQGLTQDSFPIEKMQIFENILNESIKYIQHSE